MKRRTASDEERQLFEQVFKEGRPIKPVTAKAAAKKKTTSTGPSGINGATRDRLRKGLMEPDARIDLHGKTQAAAHRMLFSWLVNAHIGQYSHGNIMNHEPTRRRKLLLHRKEIDRLLGETREKGLTLVPTKLYLKNGRVKLELAIGKGKKLHDKRESERAREMNEEARAGMRRRAKE